MAKPIANRLLIFIAIATLFSYCKKPTEFKEIEINNLFSLQIPTYFHSTTDLLPFTANNIHQYEDSTGKICLLVFDTSRAGFEITSLITFYDSMVANPILDSVKISPPQLIKVDNDSAYQSEITGKLNNNTVFSEIETIATKDHFYCIQAWSNLSKRQQLKPDVYKILSSFHELNYPKK